ncbi:hypothetical protein KR51_00008000 [Rubidibacter lacunae KORDI 51-2]|uniref:DUF4327 domain-containing protein n=2 Tax=Rubidibacter TaxID=582491 RepID=U5DLD0_9CHRO|nr:hypothetical protein KR51_00008000 [Rubidibacter lacunae KORDI 51-2]
MPTAAPAAPERYSIETLREEARHLVDCGHVSPHQPLYILCQFIPPREWICVECELERNDFLLRDCVADLIGAQTWQND